MLLLLSLSSCEARRGRWRLGQNTWSESGGLGQSSWWKMGLGALPRGQASCDCSPAGMPGRPQQAPLPNSES